MSADEMPSTYVEIDISTAVGETDSLGAAFDRVAQALHAMPLDASADLAADLGTSMLTFCITFDRNIEPAAALRESLETARDAITAAGFDPADWEIARATVEPRGAQKPHLVTA